MRTCGIEIGPWRRTERGREAWNAVRRAIHRPDPVPGWTRARVDLLVENKYVNVREKLIIAVIN